METMILQRNEVLIERQLEYEMKYAIKFQPLVTELLKNDFDYGSKTIMEVINDIIYSGTFDDFLKQQALIKFPEIAKMPITTEAKMSMIDIEKAFPNYNAMLLLYNTVRQLTPQIKSKIYLFELDTRNNLVLTSQAIKTAKDAHTVYARSEKQYKAFLRGQKVLNEIQCLKDETGLNLFCSNSILKYSLNPKDPFILNPMTVLVQVEP